MSLSSITPPCFSNRQMMLYQLIICMLKFPTKPKSAPFGVLYTVVNSEGKPVYHPDRKLAKKKVPMANGKFTNRTHHSFYFTTSHKKAGGFECGFIGTQKLCAECKSFKCSFNTHDCCCCLLFNEPDFSHTLKHIVKLMVFRSKFHCELNFIKQCWEYAKMLLS